MSTDDISWLAEPQARALFMQFPLPLAVLGRDGHIKLLNDCFNKTFLVECLSAENFQKIVCELNDHIFEAVPFQCKECASVIFVRAVNLGDNVIVVLEKSAESAYLKELTELHQRVLELEKISATDRLTGAWNRAHFDRIIAIELARSVRYRQPTSLILFDIDHFKQINDSFGHLAGDAVLCELVKVVNANIRVSDMLFRWGGEEFVILAASTHYRAAQALAETLRGKIAGHDIDGVGRITVSLGVAEYLSSESEEHWFERADAALYAAKNNGRNRGMIDARGNSDAWASLSENSMILHLNWHNSYNCGQPVIDEEHQKLFDLANVLMNAAFARGENPQVFQQALDTLLEHVVKHFADEEAILKKHHYPDLEIHARAHKRLVERALQLRDEAAVGGVTVGELVDFLGDEVVARHMLKTDREFYPLFENEPVQA